MEKTDPGLHFVRRTGFLSGVKINKTALFNRAALLWFIGGRMWVTPQVYEKEILVIYFILSYYIVFMTKQCLKYELYVNISKVGTILRYQNDVK